MNEIEIIGSRRKERGIVGESVLEEGREKWGQKQLKMFKLSIRMYKIVEEKNYSKFKV